MFFNTFTKFNIALTIKKLFFHFDQSKMSKSPLSLKLLALHFKYTSNKKSVNICCTLIPVSAKIH